MNPNQLIKPEVTQASEQQIQEMNTVVSRIVELIKEKHL
jgi:hypothetical protein